MATDKTRQPPHEIFSIKRKFQQSKFRPSKFKQFSVWGRQIWVTLLNARFLTI